MSNGKYNVEDYAGSDYAKITAAINAATSAIAYSVWGVSATGFNIAFRPIGNSTTDGVFSWRVTLQ